MQHIYRVISSTVPGVICHHNLVESEEISRNFLWLRSVCEENPCKASFGKPLDWFNMKPKYNFVVVGWHALEGDLNLQGPVGPYQYLKSHSSQYIVI